MATDPDEVAPLPLRELPPKVVPGERRRRWFYCERSDLIVWLNDDGSPWGFQFCYDKELSEHAITWMPDCGFSHMRVDSGEGGSKHKATPVLVPNGVFDAAYILEAFSRDSEVVPGEYSELVSRKIAELLPRP